MKDVRTLLASLNGKKIAAKREPDQKLEARNSSPLCQCQCRR